MRRLTLTKKLRYVVFGNCKNDQGSKLKVQAKTTDFAHMNHSNVHLPAIYKYDIAGLSLVRLFNFRYRFIWTLVRFNLHWWGKTTEKLDMVSAYDFCILYLVTLLSNVWFSCVCLRTQVG